MEHITTLGIDLAKNVFQLHGLNAMQKTVLKKKLSRDALLPFIAKLSPCLIGMEACASAHYFAKQFQAMGHTVKLMSPQYVKPYVKTSKNDAKDAEACAEAVTRPNMRFVSIKTDTQCELQSIHRIRTHFVKEKTSLMNMIRGLLAEWGIAIPKREGSLKRKLEELTELENGSLNINMKELMTDLYESLKTIFSKVDNYTKQIKALSKKDPLCCRLETIPGVGPIISTALVAKIGNGAEFSSGRGLSAFLGLVPKQNSSGGVEKLSGITKHGDRYLRYLLIHGGRSCAKAVLEKKKGTDSYKKEDPHSAWVRELIMRCGKNKTAVAIANKNARIAIALLKSGEDFNPATAHSY